MLVIIILLGAASIFITTKLQVANSLPRFFPENSNVQKFIDWQKDGSLTSDGKITGRTGCQNVGEYKDICGVCGGDGSS